MNIFDKKQVSLFKSNTETLVRLLLNKKCIKLWTYKSIAFYTIHVSKWLKIKVLAHNKFSNSYSSAEVPNTSGNPCLKPLADWSTTTLAVKPQQLLICITYAQVNIVKLWWHELLHLNNNKIGLKPVSRTAQCKVSDDIVYV